MEKGADRVRAVKKVDDRTYEKVIEVRVRYCLECDCRYDKHSQTWEMDGTGKSWCSVCRKYCYRIV